MASKKETDKFLTHKKKKSSSKSKTCRSRWWKQEYHHQELICPIIESFKFRALVIFLVVADTSLIIAELMLDSFKIHYECKNKDHHHPLTIMMK